MDLVVGCYRITSYNVCYTKLLRPFISPKVEMAKEIKLDKKTSDSEVTMSCCHSKKDCD